MFDVSVPAVAAAHGHAALHAIGLTPALMLQPPNPEMLAELAGRPDRSLMRVTEVQRASLLLHDGHALHPARLLPALRSALAGQDDALAVGDWVVAERDAHGDHWACERLAPRNQLARRLHDGRDKVTRTVIVANVDTALLVMGLDHDFNLRRLERYVTLVRLAGVAAVVVLTKADLCADPAGRLGQVQAGLPGGVAALALDALADDVAGALAPWLVPGSTLVLLGSSGAGKSTLTNALVNALVAGPAGQGGPGGPGWPQAVLQLQQRTGSTRHGDGRGRHTTTARSLHLTPAGACIIDTPGLRTLRLDGEPGQLASVFDDVARLAPQCRFRDCRHEQEPGCAVRAGVSAERLHNFHKLEREARRDSLSVLERQARHALWKQRSRAARARDKVGKGG
ncbi:MAG: putative ribosome biosis GTPase RsgA [Pseudomonadota bacterium]